MASPQSGVDFDRVTFLVVRFLLGVVATLSGFGVLLLPFRERTVRLEAAAEPMGPALLVAFAVALVGLAVCYRPGR